MAETQREAQRHESRDISIRLLVLVGFGLGALLVVSFLLMRGVLAMFTSPPQPSTMWRVESPPPPPEPRLQVAPRQDLRQLQAREDAVLSSYGWVDRETKIVRIPIARAMELLMERGLAVRPKPPAPQGEQGG